jgi:hypothetical protein
MPDFLRLADCAFPKKSVSQSDLGQSSIKTKFPLYCTVKMFAHDASGGEVQFQRSDRFAR